ncbi:MAG: hypothetical protein WA323_09700 [Candidatus Nitrosopolaris sp.]
MNSISNPSLLFGSFLSILIIATSFNGWSGISFIFSAGQMEAFSIKCTPHDKPIALKPIATNARVINTTNESETAGNNTAASNSAAFHNNSSINSTSVDTKDSNKFATSCSPSALLTKSSSKSTYNYNSNNSYKPLSISIQSSQKIVNGRGTSTVTAIAYDGTTWKEIENAVVRIKITFPSNGTSKEIVGHDGHVTFSAQIKPNSKDNSNISFKSTVLASAPGYISTSKAISSYSSTSTITHVGSHHQEEKQSIINKNSSSELAQNILKNVQKKLEQNGIDFALGK